MNNGLPAISKLSPYSKHNLAATSQYSWGIDANFTDNFERVIHNIYYCLSRAKYGLTYISGNKKHLPPKGYREGSQRSLKQWIKL